MIYFDSSSSWEQVAQHIGDALKAEGYEEQGSKLADMSTKIPTGSLPGGGALKDMAKGFLDTTRMYKKEGSGYTVTLTNMKSFMESKIYSQIKKLRKDGSGDPAGQYMLLVSKHGDAASAGGAPDIKLPGK